MVYHYLPYKKKHRKIGEAVFSTPTPSEKNPFEDDTPEINMSGWWFPEINIQSLYIPSGYLT
jgi:hypothetical protein